MFFTPEGAEAVPLVDNFRPVQELNGRKVTSNDPAYDENSSEEDDDDTDSASAILLSSVGFVFCLMSSWL